MVESDLKALICKSFLDGDTDFPLALDTNLLEEGICDSLGLVRLAGKIEKQIPGIKIRDQEITRDNFSSMRKILAFVEKKARA
jgi:acyl carrier protein